MAATLWLSGGKIVTNAQGQPILCGNCPCQCMYYYSAPNPISPHDPPAWDSNDAPSEIIWVPNGGSPITLYVGTEGSPISDIAWISADNSVTWAANTVDTGDYTLLPITFPPGPISSVCLFGPVPVAGDPPGSSGVMLDTFPNTITAVNSTTHTTVTLTRTVPTTSTTEGSSTYLGSGYSVSYSDYVWTFTDLTGATFLKASNGTGPVGNFGGTTWVTS